MVSLFCVKGKRIPKSYLSKVTQEVDYKGLLVGVPANGSSSPVLLLCPHFKTERQIHVHHDVLKYVYIMEQAKQDN